MHEKSPAGSGYDLQRQQVLSRWDENYAREPSTTAASATIAEGAVAAFPFGDAELVNMRIRVIALENLVIALLVEATPSQIAVAVEMAGYISPREGFTPHPLTVKAASHMKDLVARAVSYRVLET